MAASPTPTRPAVKARLTAGFFVSTSHRTSHRTSQLPQPTRHAPTPANAHACGGLVGHPRTRGRGRFAVGFEVECVCKVRNKTTGARLGTHLEHTWNTLGTRLEHARKTGNYRLEHMERAFTNFLRVGKKQKTKIDDAYREYRSRKRVPCVPDLEIPAFRACSRRVPERSKCVLVGSTVCDARASVPVHQRSSISQVPQHTVNRDIRGSRGIGPFPPQ